MKKEIKLGTLHVSLIITTITSLTYIKVIPYTYFLPLSLLAVLLFRVTRVANFEKPKYTSRIIILTLALCIGLDILYGFSTSTMKIYLGAIILTLLVPKTRLEDTELYYSIVTSTIILSSYLAYQYTILDINGRSWSQNPIIVSTYAAILASLGYALTVKSKKINKPLVISIIALSFIISLSETRGSVLSLFISLAVITIVTKGYKNKVNIAIATVMLLTCISNDGVLKRIEKTIQFSAETQNQVDNIGPIEEKVDRSSGIRISMWKAGIEVINDNFPNGVGDSLSEQVHDKMIKADSKYQWFKPTHLHNQYLQSFAQYGLLGIITLAIILAPTIYSYYSRRDTAALTLLCFGIVILTSSMTDATLYYKEGTLALITGYILFHYMTEEQS